MNSKKSFNIFYGNKDLRIVDLCYLPNKDYNLSRIKGESGKSIPRNKLIEDVLEMVVDTPSEDIYLN